ncbi:uncharacterized protein [Montipora capricornis]|uniref:uncharacterized protein n=1 Tax=Montipora capricornis TaxID=246305 RepID=UPI0035F12559
MELLKGNAQETRGVGCRQLFFQVLSSSSDFISRAVKTNSVFCERISVLLLFCVKVIMANNTVTVNNKEIVQVEASEESAKLKITVEIPASEKEKVLQFVEGCGGIRVAHRPITTLRKLLTNVKDKDQPRDRQGAVYKIKCCDCQATYIGETGRNLNTRLTEHRRATRNGDINNNIAEHHLQTNHRIDWDSATCVTYNTNYYQRIVLESWFPYLEQTPINRCLQLPAPYKRLIDDINRQTTD